MRIEYLADHPSLIPALARWHQDQWSYLSPERTIEQRMATLRAHLYPTQIPTSFVALSRDTLLGGAGLVAHDMDTRMDLSPWLACVYVAPEYRRQGIGTALVQRVVEEARTLGVDALHLFTPDKEGFYARLGWSVIERTRYRDCQVAVMALQGMLQPSDNE
jgi:GNAT superfamily N-acetyltransferase